MGMPRGIYRGKNNSNYGKRYIQRSKIYPELEKLTSEQVAWIAGIIEGEGSFIAEKRRNGEFATRVYASARITVNMTDRDVIEKLAELAGGRVNLERQKAPNRKDQWKWTFRGYENVIILTDLLRPWMFERRTGQLDHMLVVVNEVRQEVWDSTSATKVNEG